MHLVIEKIFAVISAKRYSFFSALAIQERSNPMEMWSSLEKECRGIFKLDVIQLRPPTWPTSSDREFSRTRWWRAIIAG